jgi:hypothetical protein
LELVKIKLSREATPYNSGIHLIPGYIWINFYDIQGAREGIS